MFLEERRDERGAGCLEYQREGEDLQDVGACLQCSFGPVSGKEKNLQDPRWEYPQRRRAHGDEQRKDGDVFKVDVLIVRGVERDKVRRDKVNHDAGA